MQFICRKNVCNYLWMLIIFILNFNITQIISLMIVTIKFVPNLVWLCISAYKGKINVSDFIIKTVRRRKNIKLQQQKLNLKFHNSFPVSRDQ